MMRKKGKELIPFEKAQKVIRLEDRGRERELKFGKWLFGILAVLCLIYCAAIGLFIGHGTNFYLIWGLMGAGFMVMSLFCGKPSWRRRLPAWIFKVFWILFGIGLAIFILVEGLVISACSADGCGNADYIIVLGAQWKTTGPSRVLKYRLDKAVEYLKQYPETKAIVSGGRGSNEPIAEADGMHDYLVSAGIEKERILVENTSRNTYENLKNSAAFINKEEDTVVLVTNDFHVFRARQLAAAQGYKKIRGLAADSYPPMQVHNMFREFFGVVKDFVMGNLVYWERDR
ncbi:MAG: YdcF family protein [Lachnospiraceae bacterium]|nr:YdcF family protein [Lachnospiraceae bacterium]